ncbi:hypothetical protein QQF64_014652, partial [Cirrhinus molitorella]
MAARAQREAQRLSSFCSFAVFLLLISGLFMQNSCALTSYTRQELLDISLHISDSFISNLRLAPEIAKTTEAAHPTRPGGSARRRRRDRKQRRGNAAVDEIMASSPKVRRTTKPRDGVQNLPRFQKDAYARLLNQHQKGKFRSYLQELAKQQVEENTSTSVSRSVNVVNGRKKGNSDSSYSIESLSSHQNRHMADAYISLYTDKTSHQVTCTENQGMKHGMLEELHKAAAPKKVPSKQQHKRSEKDIKVCSSLVGSEEGDSQQLSCSCGEEQAKNKSKKKRSERKSEKKDKEACGPEAVPIIAGKSPNKNIRAPHTKAPKESLLQNNNEKGTKGGRGSWKQQFEQYMSTEDVFAGLKRGELIQGVLRINPKKYKEAFVPSPDGSADIFLDGVAARNRALNGDIVVVKVLPPEQWKAVNGDVNESTSANQMAPEAPDVIVKDHYNEDDEVIGKMKNVSLHDK